MKNLGRVLGMFLVIGLFGVRSLEGACSNPCRPFSWGSYSNGTNIQLAAGSGISSGQFDTVMNAAGEWNSALSVQNSSVEFVSGSGQWVVSIDSTLPSYVAGETDFNNKTLRINSAKVAQLYAIALHEIGHVLKLDDVYTSGCSGQTAMAGNLSENPGTVTAADDCTLEHVYKVRDESPIVLPLHQGFPEFTAPDVFFDLSNCGTPQLLGWTGAGTGQGFLAFDRDADGQITSGAELFGNYTPLPGTLSDYLAMDGFQALAAFDEPQSGGNGDNWITAQDSIFPSLAVWIDANHDGFTDPNELKTLDELRIEAISLSPRESRKRDRHGNEMRYVAPFLVRDETGRLVRRHAVDVYFVQK